MKKPCKYKYYADLYMRFPGTSNPFATMPQGTWFIGEYTEMPSIAEALTFLREHQLEKLDLKLKSWNFCDKFKMLGNDYLECMLTNVRRGEKVKHPKPVEDMNTNDDDIIRTTIGI